MFEEYSNHDVATYAAYIDDAAELLTTTSGGIATALARSAIIRGGYVAGVKYSNDFKRAEYFLTNCIADIELFKGSKYCAPDIGNIYAEVYNCLREGNDVLFFGLPCIVAALNKKCAVYKERLLTCELICHGPTKGEVQKEYIELIEKRYKSKVDAFSVRYKNNGLWGADNWLYAHFENGSEMIKPLDLTEYGVAFSIMPLKSCYNCRFRGNYRTGDIMIGDFWGASEEDEFWNEKGVSVVFAETIRGNDEINKLAGIKLYSVPFEKAVEKNRNVVDAYRKKYRYTDSFEIDYKRSGLYKSTIMHLLKRKVVTLPIFYSIYGYINEDKGKGK